MTLGSIMCHLTPGCSARQTPRTHARPPARPPPLLSLPELTCRGPLRPGNGDASGGQSTIKGQVGLSLHLFCEAVTGGSFRPLAFQRHEPTVTDELGRTLPWISVILLLRCIKGDVSYYYYLFTVILEEPCHKT